MSDRSDPSAGVAARFEGLSTALVCDACTRLDVSVRLAPSDIRPLDPTMRVAGPARPVRHAGSVDVFLEAIDAATPGDVLVIDDGGRRDQGCVGDLTALEARAAGLAGLVVWGVHRDDRELRTIGWPVFSLGTCPLGPTRLEPREDDALQRARLGEHDVDEDDTVFADADGVIVIRSTDVEAVLGTAEAIATTERTQASLIDSGTPLRAQLRFDDYLARRRAEKVTFREHLRSIGGAIEE